MIRSAKPTDAEMEILRVLWEFGPATVRFIHDKICPTKKITYTATLKTMQIMVKKGLLGRDKSQRSHVYQAKIGETQTRKVFLEGVLKTAFGGSTKALVMQALGNRETTHEELDEIRDFLDKVEKGDA